MVEGRADTNQRTERRRGRVPSRFCRNLKTLDLIRYQALEEELSATLTDDSTNDLDESPSMVEWYIGLLAGEGFRER